MKIFEFEKQGIKFYFRNPMLNRYGKLVMDYKIEREKENQRDPEGYFYNSEFLLDKNAMSFYDVKIKGQKVGGVGLPEETLKEVKNIYEQLKTERENNINQILNELVEGKRNIHFGIVGCDYPYYQAWVRNLPKDLDGLEQDIMTKAIKVIIGNDEYISNSCEYLQKFANKHIGFVDELGNNILNPEFDEESQKYHGYKNTIVTGFEMNLKDILQPAIEKKTKKDNLAKEKELRKAQFKVCKVYECVYPKGGEDGTDGYYDADITDGEQTIRFVARNVFDFGFYVYPKRVEGTDEVFKRENWTEIENKINKWLTEFSPFTTNIRM